MTSTGINCFECGKSISKYVSIVNLYKEAAAEYARVTPKKDIDPSKLELKEILDVINVTDCCRIRLISNTDLFKAHMDTSI